MQNYFTPKKTLKPHLTHNIPRPIAVKTLPKRIQKSQQSINYQDIFSSKLPFCPQNPLFQRGTGTLWFRTFMNSKERSAQAQKCYKEGFFDKGKYLDPQKQELSSKMTYQKTMNFNIKPKTEKERIEEIVESNARSFDNSLPAKNYNVEGIRRHTYRDQWLAHDFKKYTKEEMSTRQYSFDPYQGGYEQTGDLSRKNDRSKQLSRPQFISRTLEDGMGRRTLISNSLRTAEAYHKLNLPRETALNPMSKLRFYKKSLKNLKEPILHSQNYKSIEYKNMLKNSEPKLYPMSLSKRLRKNSNTKIRFKDSIHQPSHKKYPSIQNLDQEKIASSPFLSNLIVSYFQ